MLRKEIYEEIKNKGFRGGSTAFYEWFKKQFSICSEISKNFRKTYAGINVDEYKKKNRKCFMSAIILSIYISSETYGINTDTGELTQEYISAHEMIENSKILSYLKTINKIFRYTLRKGKEQNLFTWLKICANSKYIQLSNFARTIKNDIEPVLNAIKCKYTNGLVEGHVNRLKTKKREMYGRAGFELLRRKVCLSKF